MASSHQEADTFAEQLISLLGETEAAPIAQVRRIVLHFGVAHCARWLAQTKQIEESGGEMILNGHRRRTSGGVFFRVVRDALPPEEQRVFFPLYRPTRATQLSAKEGSGDVWANRDAWVHQAQHDEGKATTVKITVIGTVNKAVERQGFTLVTMQHEGKLQSLPKGIPIPPLAFPTHYILYIGVKQWKKVKESLRNPDDVLIAEGTPVLDPKYQAVTVFVTSTTTKLLQAAQREAQKTKNA